MYVSGQELKVFAKLVTLVLYLKRSAGMDSTEVELKQYSTGCQADADKAFFRLSDAIQKPLRFFLERKC